MSIGSNIRAIHTESGLTGLQFASKIGCSKASLYLYESDDREPPVTVILNICRAFRVSADWLLCLSNDNNITINVTDVPRDVINGINLILSTIKNG